MSPKKCENGRVLASVICMLPQALRSLRLSGCVNLSCTRTPAVVPSLGRSIVALPVDAPRELRANDPSANGRFPAPPSLNFCILSNYAICKKGGGFYACSTSAFKLNYFETASGIRFVLCTELGAGDMREVLRHIFSNIFVECLTKNPMWKADEPISCPLFVQQLTNYLDGI
eukprot:6202047-Pleurochrysis_carterae.AAC.2